MAQLRRNEKYNEETWNKEFSKLLDDQWLMMDQNKDGHICVKDAEIYMTALSFEPACFRMTWDNLLRRHKAHLVNNMIPKAAWKDFRTKEQSQGAKDMFASGQNPMEILDEEVNLKNQLEAGLKAKK